MRQPFKSPAAWLSPRSVGAVVLVSAVLGAGGFAWASVQDLLQLPAMKAPKAAKALTLNIASMNDSVLVVGERGIILARVPADTAGAVKDGEGNFWLQMNSPVAVNLTSVRFASDKVVYAVGHDGVVLKSEDKGQNWVKVFDGNNANQQVVAFNKSKVDAAQKLVDELPANAPASQREVLLTQLDELQLAMDDAEAGARFGPARPLLDVWFQDENTGWVVGSYGQIFETTNGGKDWTLIANRLNNPDARHYNGIWGDGKGLILIAGEAGRVYESKDGGQTFKRHDTGYNGHLYGVLATPSETGGLAYVAYGFRGNLYRLGAGSDQWYKLSGSTGDSLVGAVFHDQRVILVDQSGRLLALESGATQVRVLTQKEGLPTTGLARVGNELIVSAQGGPRTLKIPQ